MIVSLLLFLSIIISINFANRLTRPIINLIGASEKISTGDLNAKVQKINSDKEFEKLNENFNSMIDKLKKQQDKLLMSERHMAWESVARKLAHEIKNPLTPIQLSIERIKEKYLSKIQDNKEDFSVYLNTINKQIKDIEILVNEPEEVGSDRLVNAASAHQTYGGPLIVIDFGTATTFDVVDKNGAYSGGVIAPGINLSLDALHLAAAKLPRVAVQKPETVIGKRTVSAMMSGIYWGYVGLIEGLLTRIKDEFGEEMNVIATGGLAPLFSDEIGVDHLDPNLILKGLVHIYHRNS